MRSPSALATPCERVIFCGCCAIKYFQRPLAIDGESRRDLLMPTYEYRCPKGHEFELVQRMSDAPGAACPECGEMSERLLSGGAGLIFKGEGFYITDYRSDAYKKAASSDKESTASTDKGSDGAKGGSSSPSKAASASGASSSGASSKESSKSSKSSKSSSSD